jgi:hypothetical protein
MLEGVMNVAHRLFPLGIASVCVLPIYVRHGGVFPTSLANAFVVGSWRYATSLPVDFVLVKRTRTLNPFLNPFLWNFYRSSERDLPI